MTFLKVYSRDWTMLIGIKVLRVLSSAGVFAKCIMQNRRRSGLMVVHWTLDQMVQVRALAGSWARHFTLIVPLSTQVYK